MVVAVLAAISLLAVATSPAAPADGPPNCRDVVATESGSSEDDRLVGTPGDDVLVGRGGRDILIGKGGADILCGGGGVDELRAGPGTDRLDGGSRGDSLTGGPASDRVHGRRGDDLASGSDGDDRIYGEAGDDELDGGEGTDSCGGGAGVNLKISCERLGRNRVPVAGDDAFTTGEAPTRLDVLADDSDADGDVLSIVAVDDSGAEGNATISPDGRFIDYDPGNAFDALAPGETATDRFSYTVADGHAGKATAEVVLTIEGVDTPPVAVADTITVPYVEGFDLIDYIEDESNRLAYRLLANDTDVDGGPLYWDGVERLPEKGVIFIEDDGGAEGQDGYYVTESFACPDAPSPDVDSFVYTVNGGSAATVTVNIDCSTK